MRAGTVLPSYTTKETELRAAMARHVVTSMVQVDDGEAPRTGLPTDFTGKSTQLVDGFALPACITRMGWLTTGCTSLDLAIRAKNVRVAERTRFA